MPVPDFDRLTEGQKQCLRLIWHERLKIAEVAYRLGLADDTVDQRLRATRRHLGVGSSMEAARLLAEHEADTRGVAAIDREPPAPAPASAAPATVSPSSVYPASVVPEEPSPGPSGSGRDGAGADRWRWPLPRWNGEENTLGVGQRLFWVFAIMLGSLTTMMLALSMGEALTRLSRMLK